MAPTFRSLSRVLLLPNCLHVGHLLNPIGTREKFEAKDLAISRWNHRFGIAIDRGAALVFEVVELGIRRKWGCLGRIGFTSPNPSLRAEKPVVVRQAGS